jgi:hypothetical protein
MPHSLPFSLSLYASSLLFIARFMTSQEDFADTFKDSRALLHQETRRECWKREASRRLGNIRRDGVSCCIEVSCLQDQKLLTFVQAQLTNINQSFSLH